MADDLSKKGPSDRSRIHLTEPYEVQYWADKFDVSKERLSEAVRKVGTRRTQLRRSCKRILRSIDDRSTRRLFRRRLRSPFLLLRENRHFCQGAEAKTALERGCDWLAPG
jgi:Protein of unknown function (DUF3606)